MGKKRTYRPGKEKPPKGDGGGGGFDWGPFQGIQEWEWLQLLLMGPGRFMSQRLAEEEREKAEAEAEKERATAEKEQEREQQLISELLMSLIGEEPMLPEVPEAPEMQAPPGGWFPGGEPAPTPTPEAAPEQHEIYRGALMGFLEAGGDPDVAWRIYGALGPEAFQPEPEPEVVPDELDPRWLALIGSHIAQTGLPSTLESYADIPELAAEYDYFGGLTLNEIQEMWGEPEPSRQFIGQFPGGMAGFEVDGELQWEQVPGYREPIQAPRALYERTWFDEETGEMWGLPVGSNTAERIHGYQAVPQINILEATNVTQIPEFDYYRIASTLGATLNDEGNRIIQRPRGMSVTQFNEAILDHYNAGIRAGNADVAESPEGYDIEAIGEISSGKRAELQAVLQSYIDDGYTYEQIIQEIGAALDGDEINQAEHDLLKYLTRLQFAPNIPEV